MRYRSTRGTAAGKEFADVLVEGLASDGGLYVPAEVPSLPSLPDDYAGVVARIAEPFIRPDPLADELEEICQQVYTRFRHPEVAPLRPMGGRRSLLELFWGPTLSFKDYALQLVGALFDRVLARRGQRMLILGATSGDTGSAAIEACRGREGMDIVILFPKGAVSEFQRRQMTTVPDANVHAVAVEGTFDDCQRLAKEAFGRFRHLPLGAINSINWARIMAQTAYYAHAADRVGEPTHFVVPTGNFGNVYAAHFARRMGVPVGALTVANNANHGLTDLIRTGRLTVESVVPTLSPAMDIQVPSNLERYLFEVLDEDPAQVRAVQERMAAEGIIAIPGEVAERVRRDLAAGFRTDREIEETIRRVYDQREVVLDPHTAVAWAVAEDGDADLPTVVVATAHPAKFGETLREVTGVNPKLPAGMESILTARERTVELPADLAALGDLLDSVVG